MDTTAQQAFGVFQEIYSGIMGQHIKASDVYWASLNAERDGIITIGEMDAVSVYHKAEVVSLYNQEMDWVMAEAKEQAEAYQAQSDYWDDYEAGLV